MIATKLSQSQPDLLRRRTSDVEAWDACIGRCCAALAAMCERVVLLPTARRHRSDPALGNWSDRNAVISGNPIPPFRWVPFTGLALEECSRSACVLHTKRTKVSPSCPQSPALRLARHAAGVLLARRTCGGAHSGARPPDGGRRSELRAVGIRNPELEVSEAAKRRRPRGAAVTLTNQP